MVQKQRKIRFEGTSSSSIVTGRIDGKLNTMAWKIHNFLHLRGNQFVGSFLFSHSDSASFYSSPPERHFQTSFVLWWQKAHGLPMIDTIRIFNVEILNSGHHQNRVLSSKASVEPPLFLASSVHCVFRAARRQLLSWRGIEGSDSAFKLSIPATIPVVKDLCGLDMVESYLQWTMSRQ
ncbi:indole-3-acetaldehyde oxidase-like [Tripterygium wilfordii]|uniref:indole-3-acetaldehyde oxidase-like n=1 Tax=Tripterygium wilfordii TaxID=458696 RepID=UPI0018F82AF0|nr:indole-3-acetaldehyde oxidase-like [Tripterygium wilfordii]